MSTKHRTQTLTIGLNGSGHKIWIVTTEWTKADGRTGRQREVFETEAEARSWITHTAPPAAGGEDLTARDRLETTIRDIARRELGIETLMARNRDRLDFHEVSVWGLHDALKAAFEAGAKAAADTARKS